MSNEESTATADSTQTEAEAPFGTTLETFFQAPDTPAPTTVSTPKPETQATEETTDEPTADAGEDEKAQEGQKSPPKKKGSARPMNVEAKLKGLEKGFYKVTRENAELRKKLQAMEGVPDDPPDHTPEQVAQAAEFNARQKVSLEQAVKHYGEDHVTAQIFEEGSPYRQLVEIEGKTWIRDRVLASDDPIQTALDAIQEEELHTHYGRDIETIKQTLKEELKAEVLKELKANPSEMVGKKPPGLTGARSNSNQPHKVTSNAPNLDGLNPAFNLRAIA